MHGPTNINVSIVVKYKMSGSKCLGTPPQIFNDVSGERIFNPSESSSYYM